MKNPTLFFNEWAPKYDEYLGKSPYYDELIERLVTSMPLHPHDKVLDIGIGTGNVAWRFIDKVGCSVAGIDISTEMLDVCLKNATTRGVNLDLRHESILQTTHLNASFHAAVAAFALHHIPDAEKYDALLQIHRILKPGGRVGIAEVVVDEDGDLHSRKRLKHILERWGAAALLALENGGPEYAKVELEAIQTIYAREGEYLLSSDGWSSAMRSAGFNMISSECTNEILGHWVFVGEKRREA